MVHFYLVKNVHPSQTSTRQKFTVLKKRTAEEDEEVLDELPLILIGHCKADLSLHAITHTNRLLLWK